MNEQKNNGRGIFYGVIGVATLVVAIIGATFAYFTASASSENKITGNMATINIGLEVTKVTTSGDVSGLIPMSNNMVEVAVNTTTANRGNTNICIDDNGNAVCQVYKATVSNTSAAAVFVDGYVALKGGSGNPTDYTYTADTGASTTMRWAQVSCTESANVVTSCSTAITGVGTSLGVASGQTGNDIAFDAIGVSGLTGVDAKNTANIRTDYKAVKTGFTTSANVPIGVEAAKGVLAEAKISGNSYAVIGTNYIRVSDHKWSSTTTMSADEFYSQSADVTSALVYNQLLAANTGSKDYYFVVWLSETGTNQTANSAGAGASTKVDDFFQGQVKFLSAQGSEVSATFGGYTRVAATDNTGAPANNG